MIAASGNEGRVHAVPAWAEFGRGAAWTAEKPALWAVEWTAFQAVSSSCICAEHPS
jgi:hypothetical protein